MTTMMNETDLIAALTPMNPGGKSARALLANLSKEELRIVYTSGELWPFVTAATCEAAHRYFNRK